jgi:hypothetical protein
MRLIALALLTAGLIAGPPSVPALRAQPTQEIVLSAKAQTGTDTRDVRFSFMCSANHGPGVIGVLEIGLAVPGFERLAPLFPFDDFEGPDAHAGKLTSLEATAEGGTVRDTFWAAGWIGGEADHSFHFGVNGMLRNDAPRLAAVAAVLRKVVAGPGKLVWRQGNTRPGGVPIIATLTITTADAARVGSVLRPCLAAAGGARHLPRDR